MAKEKITYPKFITPKGSFIYPWLTKADTRFNPEGVYSCGLSMAADEAESFIKKLDDLLEKTYQDAVKAAKPQDKNKLSKEEAWSVVYDSDGNETDRVSIKTKLKATITAKDGTTYTQAPKLFDSKGQPLPAKISPYGGTIGKLSVEAVPYTMASTKKVGISLRLKAAQVINLVQGGGGGDADSYGFGKEDGFEVSSDTPFDISDIDTPSEEEDF